MDPRDAKQCAERGLPEFSSIRVRFNVLERALGLRIPFHFLYKLKT